MQERWFYVAQLFFALLITTTTISCSNSPSSTTQGSINASQTSQYPADINGRVTMADVVTAKYPNGLNAGQTLEMQPVEGQTFWIVDISVKNNSYKDAIVADRTYWKIVANEKVYNVQNPFMNIQSVYPMTVSPGETGQTIIRFSVKDLSTKPIIMRQIACLAEYPDQITVVLEPTRGAVAGLNYKITVKKGDTVRATTSFSWTQVELQARQVKGFRFPATPDESQFYAMDRTQAGYAWKNLSKEFTVVTYTNTAPQLVEYIPVTPPFYKSWTFLWVILGIILLLGSISKIRSRGSTGYSSETQERIIHQHFQEQCPNCRGTGMWDEKHGIRCSKCNGSGVIYKYK